jgi:curli biogenesis system outer membrane secretion channel CsgG
MNKQICTPRIYSIALFLAVLLLFSITLAIAQATSRNTETPSAKAYRGREKPSVAASCGRRRTREFKIQSAEESK